MVMVASFLLGSAFKAVRHGARTYHFQADSPDDMSRYRSSCTLFLLYWDKAKCPDYRVSTFRVSTVVTVTVPPYYFTNLVINCKMTSRLAKKIYNVVVV